MRFLCHRLGAKCGENPILCQTDTERHRYLPYLASLLYLGLQNGCVIYIVLKHGFFTDIVDIARAAKEGTQNCRDTFVCPNSE